MAPQSAYDLCKFWLVTTLVTISLYLIINLVNIGYDLYAEMFWFIVKIIFLPVGVCIVDKYTAELRIEIPPSTARLTLVTADSNSKAKNKSIAIPENETVPF